MTAVEICNLALGLLGENTITTLDEAEASSVEEELCARLYPVAVDAVLEAKAWTFATTRLTLEPAQTTGLDDFPAKYLLPSTVLRVLSCDSGGGENEGDWKREGEFVLTQWAPTTVSVKAIVEVEPDKFSPAFCRAVAARLAADLCVPLTENEGLEQRLEAKYLRELAQAGHLDGQQGTGVPVRSSLLAKRRI